MKYLVSAVIAVLLFLVASNPEPCEFRAQVAETVRAGSDKDASLKEWVGQELKAALLGEAARLGTRRADYGVLSVYTLDPTAEAPLPDVIDLEGASWQYIGVGGFFIQLERPTIRISSASRSTGELSDDERAAIFE